MYRNTWATLPILASSILLIGGMIADKSAYGASVYAYGNSSGDTFTALNHQPYDFSIDEVDGATACPRPCRLVQQEGMAADGVSRDVSASRVGDYGAQWKAGKGDRSPVRFGLIVYNERGRSTDRPWLRSNVVDRPALSNVGGSTVSDTSASAKTEPSHLTSIPPVLRNIDGRLSAAGQAARDEISNDMRGRQKRAMRVDKECASIYSGDVLNAGRRLSQTNNGCDGMFGSLDRADERIILSAGYDGPKKEASGSTIPEQTSGWVNGTINPYVSRCVVSQGAGIWNVQCPEFVHPAHNQAPSKGNR